VQPETAALAWVPGVRAGVAPLRVELLLGGSVNESWRVDTDQGRFVLRIDGPSWRRPGVDREREQLLHEAASRGGLAPRLLLRAAAEGVQVCEYLEGRSWTPADFLQPMQLRRLGERLARVHALSAPAGILPFDPSACAREYVALLGAEAAAQPQTGALVANIDAAAGQVAQGTLKLSIVHGDLAHSNVLDGTELWLLDWEYSQLADPLYDVACVLAYYPEAQPHAGALLAAAGLDGADRDERLTAAVAVYRGLSELWHMVRSQPAAI
jgi:thiamine kinase-like enzyme